MYRIAGALAKEEGAKGIVTGESLGQVASQTLDNLLVLNDAADLPVFRPLIGLDKEEIIRIARDIGTFPTSTTRIKGCQAVPRKPSTRAVLEKIREIEGSLDCDREIPVRKRHRSLRQPPFLSRKGARSSNPVPRRRPARTDPAPAPGAAPRCRPSGSSPAIAGSSVTMPITEEAIPIFARPARIWPALPASAAMRREPSAMAATGSIPKASQTILTSPG